MSINIIIKSIKVFTIGNASSRVMFYLSMARAFQSRRRLKRFLHSRMQKYGVYISANARIGEGIKLPHPTGVVIGGGVIIGRNVTVFQNVTLGGARVGDSKNQNYPIIGSNVVIYAGAVIVGKVSVGDNAIIGANSVVLSDVPSGATCVGVPGKAVQSRLERSGV